MQSLELLQAPDLTDGALSIEARQWQAYLAYLHAWVEDHASPLFWGMSPVGFDEWYCNEASEEENWDGEADSI